MLEPENGCLGRLPTESRQFSRPTLAGFKRDLRHWDAIEVAARIFLGVGVDG